MKNVLFLVILEFFWGGSGGGGGGGGCGFLPTIVGYAMRGGQEKKTHQIIGGASKNCKGKN